MVRFVAMVLACAAVALVGVACGGGGGNSQSTPPAGATRASLTPLRGTATSPKATVTAGSAPAASTAAGADGTPPVVGSPLAVTPGADSAVSGAPTPDIFEIYATPEPSVDPATATAHGASVDYESTITAGIPLDVSGGGVTDPQHAIVPAPSPPPGVTPVVDSTDIAPPNVAVNDVELIVDANASEPGIQASRDVHVGDIVRVAVVVTNAPPYANNLGGIGTIQFDLDYDKTKLVAPTIVGGSSTDRNPDLNANDLGGPDANWDCLPSPQGDRDDPGSPDGDGDPATGQAFLSCFTPGTGHASGTIVLAVVTFQATAPGTSELSLAATELTDGIEVPFAHCSDSALEPTVPCVSAEINVK